MSKVAIISFNQERFMPYLTFYKDILSDNSIEYDYYTWNRGEKYLISQNEICFEMKIGTKKVGKIPCFFAWRKWILSHLKEKKYDKIIVLTSIPAVLLSSYLIKEYKNKYIFDIRDYTYEKFGFYKRIIKNLIDNSYQTFISSNGFRRWLPEYNDKIKNVHNLPNDINMDTFSENIFDDFSTLNIGYLGSFAYYEKNIGIIEQLKNKTDVKLYYIGSFSGKKNILEEYAKENHVENIFFGGRYSNNQKAELYRKHSINFINAVYGNESLLVSTAVPNKLYDCLVYKIPIIVSEKTYLSELVKKYNLGIAIDSEDSIYEKCWEYIKNTDSKVFLKGTNDYLNSVIKEQSVSKKIIIKFCSESI